MPHSNSKASSLSRRRTQTSATPSTTNTDPFGNVKKKVRVIVISDSSSSEEDVGADGSNSESDSITLLDSNGRKYHDQGQEADSTSEEDEEPPEKRRKKSLDQKNGKALPQNSNAKNDEDEGEEEEEYYVEKIVKMDVCPKTNKNYFLVKWLNYDSKDNTWEPEENLENSRDLVKKFLQGSTPNGVASHAKKQTRSRSVSVKSTTNNKKAVQQNQNSQTRTVLKNKNRNRIVVSSDPDPEEDVIKNRMEESIKKVVTTASSPVKTTNKTPTNNKSINCNIANSTKVRNWLDEILKGEGGEKGLSIAAIISSQPGSIYYFRVVASNGVVGCIDIDTTKPLQNLEDVYKCVVTEDLAGKKPKFIYGATTSVDGEKFCLVQFEGQDYVDIIPPQNLFAKFPSYRKFFEVHCPSLFLQKA